MTPGEPRMTLPLPLAGAHSPDELRSPCPDSPHELRSPITMGDRLGAGAHHTHATHAEGDRLGAGALSPHGEKVRRSGKVKSHRSGDKKE